jgi:hypothetical protein
LPFLKFCLSCAINTMQHLSLDHSLNLFEIRACFCGTGVWTQGFMLAWLSHLSQASCHFALIIMETGSCVLLKLIWNMIFLFHASCYSWDIGEPLFPAFLHWDGASQTFLLGLT